MGGKEPFGLSRSDKTFVQELYIRTALPVNNLGAEKVAFPVNMDSDEGWCFGKYVFRLADVEANPETLLKWKSFRIRKATWTIDYRKAYVAGIAFDARIAAGQTSSFNIYPILDRSRSYIDGAALNPAKYLSFAPPKYSLNNNYPTLNIKQMKPNFTTAVASMPTVSSVPGMLTDSEVAAVGIDSYKFMNVAGGSAVPFAGLVVMIDGVGNDSAAPAGIDEYIRVGIKLIVEFRGNSNR